MELDSCTQLPVTGVHGSQEWGLCREAWWGLESLPKLGHLCEPLSSEGLDSHWMGLFARDGQDGPGREVASSMSLAWR